MTATATARRSARDKHDERRDQLAESALRTLGDLGYARASLREIANNSEFSHGVVHYYFRDKLELIAYCVRYYKARCVTRYDSVVASATTADELVSGFVAKLIETLRDEAPMHRLWYDLRSQSMFEPGLKDAVGQIDRSLEQMVWRIVTRYSELAGRPVVATPLAAYSLLDGLFQQALLGLPDHADAVFALVAEQVPAVMPMLLEPAR